MSTDFRAAHPSDRLAGPGPGRFRAGSAGPA
ncbi:hypothetical protein JOF53_005746 [Crossiella equi]|uniref:Uncharacterized protein n=1 Tax=Crossiella equi TaxID=130796 RepID=A0ABS5AKX1_9PSEU|nr:hypothetical protein [Crossiella equi]